MEPIIDGILLCYKMPYHAANSITLWPYRCYDDTKRFLDFLIQE